MAVSSVDLQREQFFTSGQRLSPDALKELADSACRDVVVQAVLETVGGYLMLLNEYRQVLAVNGRLAEDLGVDGSQLSSGPRPGELLGCRHAHEGPVGCGSGSACRRCGAALTMLASQEHGRTEEGECAISMVREGIMQCAEFRVRCVPFEVSGQRVMALVIQDISAEKRREVLERFFIHDLKNTLQGLMGYAELLEESAAESKVSQMVVSLARHLNNEIEAQAYLMRAEKGTLEVRRDAVDAARVLQSLEIAFGEHPAAAQRYFATQLLSEERYFETDETLLLRVLVNMVKNALEAVKRGETVRVSFERREGRPYFSVWNPGAIPPEISPLIFHRSFSTKELAGRGIGTYSMKLFGEQYLGGTVNFHSSEEAGTEFFIFLPVI